ncbi:MAG: hypothetical protein IJ565_03465 [Bacilli bacterium]|nr:hypothetical protein [Bacilli bacterium]
MEAIIIILIILILVLLFKRTFSSAIYAIVIVDIFLRLIDFLRGYIRITGEIGNFFNMIPASLNAVISHTTSGVFETILLWAIFIVYIIFEYYIISTFIKKR